MRAGAERQRQNRQVAIDRSVRENLEAGDGEGRNEQIDQHQIESGNSQAAVRMSRWSWFSTTAT